MIELLLAGSAAGVAILAAVGLCVIAFYGSIEWATNGLIRHRDRITIFTLDAAILAELWVVASLTLGRS